MESDELPEYDAELTYEGRPVGRLTSATRDPEHGVIALGYVRVEVPGDAQLSAGSRTARPLDFPSPRP